MLAAISAGRERSLQLADRLCSRTEACPSLAIVTSKPAPIQSTKQQRRSCGPLSRSRSGRGIIMAVVLSAPVGASLWLDVVVGLVLAASLVFPAEVLACFILKPR